MQDTWKLKDHTFTSRFILGSGKFSLPMVRAVVEDGGAEIVTLALRRANTAGACWCWTHTARCRPIRIRC